MPESECRRLFQQLTVAVDYCHRLGIANRDIKLDNLLLQPSRDGGPPDLKMCDVRSCLGPSEPLLPGPAFTGHHVVVEIITDSRRPVPQTPSARLPV